MLKFWKKLVANKEYELKQRMFRSIVLVGGLATIIALVEILVVMELNPLLIGFMLLLLLTMGVSCIVTFRYNNCDLAAVLMGFVIVVMVFPIMFTMSGGVRSGASIWLSLGILYIFIMFSGKLMYFFLGLCFVSYAVTYTVCYLHPELIVPMPSERAVYIDSFFSLIIVGLVAGLILKSHMITYAEEHALANRQKEELKQYSNSRNAFFANMNHEIRTPINTIIGLNEMILRTSDNPEIKGYADDIQVASKMLLHQVNDILDLSRMEKQMMNIIPVQYRTISLFGDLVELIRLQAEKKGLRFQVEVDPALPKTLYGDEKRIKQVLLNILDNAVKYTKEGTVTLSADGEQNDAGEFVLKVRVSDTGIGIRKEELEHIYDSYNRVDERRNLRIVGSGLGLAITRQLVELMEGEISVDSIYTKGSVFTITLKQKIVENTPIGRIDFLQRGLDMGDVYHPSFVASQARVLVVDDNSMNNRVAQSLLTYTKMQVDVVTSGLECLERTRNKFYHIILMDDLMPEMTGAETLERLRVQENGLCRETPVIAMTANTMTGAERHYLEQGFDGYVEKPIQSELLEKEILRFLPDEVIEYQWMDEKELYEEGQMQRLIRRKQKKIYITTDCTSDLSPEILEEYGIRLMYLYIRTPHGRFADTKEIDADSLKQYVTDKHSTAFADSVTVEEYEEFFADTLTRAEEMIHLSFASNSGESYRIAQVAAGGFDHVHVVDSGQISGGQGLLAIYAATLARQGRSVEEIIEAVNVEKYRIQTRVIMPSLAIYYQNGRARSFGAYACKWFNVHPYVAVSPKKIAAVGLLAGDLQSAWRQGIAWHLRRKRRINKKVVFVTHVGCTVKEQEWIKREIMKHVDFENVVFLKASFSNACNTGLKSIAIAYSIV